MTDHIARFSYYSAGLFEMTDHIARFSYYSAGLFEMTSIDNQMVSVFEASFWQSL